MLGSTTPLFARRALAARSSHPVVALLVGIGLPAPPLRRRRGGKGEEGEDPMATAERALRVARRRDAGFGSLQTIKNTIACFKSMSILFFQIF